MRGHNSLAVLVQHLTLLSSHLTFSYYK